MPPATRVRPARSQVSVYFDERGRQLRRPYFLPPILRMTRAMRSINCASQPSCSRESSSRFSCLSSPSSLKKLATPPYKNVFEIWHFVRHKRLRRPYLRGRFSSFDKSDRKSASARFPANFAAMSDWNPSPVILMPKGILLRRISQLQRSGRSLC